MTILNKNRLCSKCLRERQDFSHLKNSKQEYGEKLAKAATMVTGSHPEPNRFFRVFPGAPLAAYNIPLMVPFGGGHLPHHGDLEAGWERMGSNLFFGGAAPGFCRTLYRSEFSKLNKNNNKAEMKEKKTKLRSPIVKGKAEIYLSRYEGTNCSPTTTTLTVHKNMILPCIVTGKLKCSSSPWLCSRHLCEQVWGVLVGEMPRLVGMRRLPAESEKQPRYSSWGGVSAEAEAACRTMQKKGKFRHGVPGKSALKTEDKKPCHAYTFKNF